MFYQQERVWSADIKTKKKTFFQSIQGQFKSNILDNNEWPNVKLIFPWTYIHTARRMALTNNLRMMPSIALWLYILDQCDMEYIFRIRSTFVFYFYFSLWNENIDSALSGCIFVYLMTGLWQWMIIANRERENCM